MLKKNKKVDKFGLIFKDMTENLREAANYFSSFEPKKAEDITIFSEKINDFELEGDKLVYKMVVLLNDTFITPIEREDLMELMNRIDDVLDAMRKAALSFEICRLNKFNDNISRMANEISLSCDSVCVSVDYMFSKQLNKINAESKKIKMYESENDALYRKALLDLFENEEDPIRLIRYKTLYENIEEISNCIEDVSKTLNLIVMKNS